MFSTLPMVIKKRKTSPTLHSLSSFVHDQKKKITMLNKYVQQNISDDKLLSDLLMIEQQKSTIGQRIADKVASFGGSWAFIISFAVFMAIWMLLNTFVLGEYGRDSYPFVLLNLCLSTIAALQAPVILMSQNRHSQIENKKAEHDYMINLKAELQIKHLHDKIDLMITEEMKKLFTVQAQQLTILKEIEKHYKKNATINMKSE